MKATHFQIIQKHLDDIQNSIVAYQKAVDMKIEKYQRNAAEDEQRLNEHALMEETERNQTILRGDRERVANSTELQITLDFECIEAELQLWACEPPSESFLKIMNAIDTFNLALDADEIVMLSQTASGSYLGNKILNGYAQKNGLQFPFVELSGMFQEIRNVKADCMLSINAYCGKEHNITDMRWLALNPDTKREYDSTRRLFSSEYITRDESSFTRLRQMLNTATDTTVSLADSEIDRIGKLFEGVEPAERFDRMKQLIETHPEVEPKLALFDPHCYKNAKAEIRHAKFEARQNALAALKEAAAAAEDARQEAVKASL